MCQAGGSMSSMVQLNSPHVHDSVGLCGGFIFRCLLEFHLEHSHVTQQRCQRSKIDQNRNRGPKQDHGR